MAVGPIDNGRLTIKIALPVFLHCLDKALALQYPSFFGLNSSHASNLLDPGNIIAPYIAPPGCEPHSTVDPLTGNETIEFLPCPEWLPDTETRLPSYCCGAEEKERRCCDWTIYVVNQIGFGKTNIGLLILVGLFFIAAGIIFSLMCLFFRAFVVSKWEQPQDAEMSRSDSARNNSITFQSYRHDESLHQLCYIDAPTPALATPAASRPTTSAL
ncbi:uncharacterized protein LOC129594393 [Paramacrobiotus metropolitanus]|uniref:uncharacterized protein LOC129594393 n=1 Tax=Paramacrobiotus metropolitanus TaxID=2943436 RepID=UPI0024461335|nr:uncharacterized protein LOC129594393 [Paramacrobiotus metropolitanus]